MWTPVSVRVSPRTPVLEPLVTLFAGPRLALAAGWAAVLAIGLLLPPAPLAAQEAREAEACEERTESAREGIDAAMLEVARSLRELETALDASADRTPRGAAPARGLPAPPGAPAEEKSSWAESCCRTELERTLRAVAALEEEAAGLRRVCHGLPNRRAASRPCREVPAAVDELARRLAAARMAASLAKAREALRSVGRITLSLAAELPEKSETREHFAPAQFVEMSDSEKLSAPAFEELTAGCRIRTTPRD